MRRADIVIALARRYVPLDASPDARAAIFREVVAAVRSAGRHAEAALLLTEQETGDALVAFKRQVEALAVPLQTAAKTTSRNGWPPAAGLSRGKGTSWD